MIEFDTALTEKVFLASTVMQHGLDSEHLSFKTWLLHYLEFRELSLPYLLIRTI